MHCASVSAKDSGLRVADYCPKITEVKEGKGCLSSPSTVESSPAPCCLVLCADCFLKPLALAMSLERQVFSLKSLS